VNKLSQFVENSVLSLPFTKYQSIK